MENLTGTSFEMWKLDAKANLSPRTVELYTDGLSRLFEGLGVSSEIFYNEYRAALDSGDSRRVTLLNNRVKITLRTEYEKYSSSHALQCYKGFLSFMRANFRDGLEFDSKDFNKFRKSQLKEHSTRIKRIPRDGIREYLEVAKNYGRTRVSKTRNVALIHVIKDSGLSRSDVVKLDVGDIRGPLEDGSEYAVIPSIRMKTGNAQVPCIGYESLTALREYLDARREPREFEATRDDGSRETVTLPGETLTDETPLFVYTQTTVNNAGEVIHEYGDRLTPDAVTFTFTQISRNAENRYSPHSLRKYNWLQLEQFLPHDWACVVQGRSINDSSSEYSLDPEDPDDWDKLLEKYAEGYTEYIAVGEKRTREEVENLKKQVEAMQVQMAGLLVGVEPGDTPNPDQLRAISDIVKIMRKNGS